MKVGVAWAGLFGSKVMTRPWALGLEKHLYGVERELVKFVGLCFPVTIGKRTIVRRYVGKALRRSGQYVNGRCVVTRGGLKFELDMREEIDLWIYLTGWWEKVDSQISLGAIAPGDTVLDVGANMGFFSLRAARAVCPGGRVFAFEPNPKTLAQLVLNARLNGLEEVIPVGVAVGEREGEARLFVPSAGNSGGASLFEEWLHARGIARKAEDGERAALSVPIVPIDLYCRQRGIDRIDFVKIDVEGSEGPVLLGAWETLTTHRPRLMVECNKRALAAAGWKVGDLLGILWDLRYRMLKTGLWSNRLMRVGAASDIELDPRDSPNLHCIP